VTSSRVVPDLLSVCERTWNMIEGVDERNYDKELILQWKVWYFATGLLIKT
jgi:hypothetical protein